MIGKLLGAAVVVAAVVTTGASMADGYHHVDRTDRSAEAAAVCADAITDQGGRTVTDLLTVETSRTGTDPTWINYGVTGLADGRTFTCTAYTRAGLPMYGAAQFDQG